MTKYLECDFRLFHNSAIPYSGSQDDHIQKLIKGGVNPGH